MNRRLLAVVAVVAVAVLAGCSLSDGGDTVTPAPVPDAQLTEESSSNDSAPSFVDTAAVERAQQIAARHADLFDNGTYRVRERFDWSQIGGDATSTTSNRTATSLYGPDGRVVHERHRLTRQLRLDRRDWTNTSTYDNGTHRYIRTTGNGTATYAVVPAGSHTGRIRPNVTRTVAQLLALRQINVTEATVDGEPGYRLSGRQSARQLTDATSEYRVTALVQDDGLVRRIALEYRRSSLGVVRKGQYVVEITPAPNATVQPPGWIEDARTATNGTR